MKTKEQTLHDFLKTELDKLYGILNKLDKIDCSRITMKASGKDLKATGKQIRDITLFRIRTVEKAIQEALSGEEHK